MSFSAKLKKKVYMRVLLDLSSLNEKVNAKSVQGLFNHKCFWNAVQYATENKNVKVIMGIYTDKKGYSYLHFWNKLADEHLETTLGFLCNEQDYYPIKEIPSEDWSEIDQIFDEAKAVLESKYVHWYERLILGKDFRAV